MSLAGGEGWRLVEQSGEGVAEGVRPEREGPTGAGKEQVVAQALGSHSWLERAGEESPAANESAVCLRPGRVTSAECSCGVALCPDGQMPQAPGMVSDFCFFPVRSYRPGCCLSTVTRTGLW